jgi:hypothetical protein
MNKTRALQSEHFVPRTFSPGALIVMLTMTIWLATPGTTVHGQSECLLACQESYDGCIRQNPGPAMQIACENAYDSCIEACL